MDLFSFSIVPFVLLIKWAYLFNFRRRKSLRAALSAVCLEGEVGSVKNNSLGFN